MEAIVVDPVFWLGLSILLVAVSLTAMLAVAIPAFRELARAARSAEKLFDTLNRELPPTLESIRLTGIEISDLTDDVSEGVQSAGQVVKQVDQSIRIVKRQAQQVQTTTRSLFTGVRAAWKTFSRPTASRRSLDRLPSSSRELLSVNDDFHNTRPATQPSYQQDYREEYLEEWEDSLSPEPQQNLRRTKSLKSSETVLPTDN
jgi:uncharacterized protein YoxC